MRSCAIGASTPWRARAPPPPRRAVVVVASSSAPKAASRELLHLPPGAWAVQRRRNDQHHHPHPPPTILVVDGTNFAAIAYRSGASSARTEFSRWLAFLSAAVGPTAATVVAFDNKQGDEGVTKQHQKQPVVLATPPPPRRGWDAAAAGAFVSGGGGGGGNARAASQLSGGAHLLLDDTSDVIPLIAPPGQTADDAIADLCRVLLLRGGTAPALAVVVASSDRDMRRLVFSSGGDDSRATAVYFLELVAGSKGEASPLRLHCGGGADDNADSDANTTEAAALALTGSSKHGVSGLDLPGITSRRSAAAMVRAAGGGLEALLRMAAAEGGEAKAAKAASPALKPAALRALADPETARRARFNYDKVRMGGREGDGGDGEHPQVVRVAADAVMGRVGAKAAEAAEAAATARAPSGDGDADNDAGKDAAAKALFPPFLRSNKRSPDDAPS